MRSDLRKHPHAASAAEAARPDRADPAAAEAGVTALYQAHALGLMRLAHIMLGDRPSAEDVVQEAFCGLYRRWSHLSDTGRALQYLRTSVLNGCRSVQRRRTRPRAEQYHGQPVVSAEATVITGEERRQVMRALRRLPPRQREVLVLRFYLDLSAEEIAATMGIGPSSVRSAAHRALASLGRMLEESS
jgi:RNA polymerase sigma-70 factor (sigma-E family)